MTILFVLSLAVAFWVTSLMIFRAITKNDIKAWMFILFAVSWTWVVTHFLDIW